MNVKEGVVGVENRLGVLLEGEMSSCDCYVPSNDLANKVVNNFSINLSYIAADIISLLSLLSFFVIICEYDIGQPHNFQGKEMCCTCRSNGGEKFLALHSLENQWVLWLITNHPAITMIKRIFFLGDYILFSNYNTKFSFLMPHLAIGKDMKTRDAFTKKLLPTVSFHVSISSYRFQHLT